MALKFLVVDDSEELASLMAEIVAASFAKADIRIAKDNHQALAILSSFDPNLITTDINHPGQSGYELLTLLRSRPETAFVPVVSISATAGSAEAELAQYRHGFDAVLPKPWQTEQVIGAISRLLRVRADPDKLLIHLGFETQSHDYKENIDLTSKFGRASLAKDVMAMANSGGGTIIVGVAERSPGEFDAIGVPKSNLTSLETSRLNRAVNEYLDPAVPVTARRVRDGNREFVLLLIPPSRESIVLVKRQNDEAGIFPGRIYIRTSAAESAELKNSFELRQLLRRIQTG